MHATTSDAALEIPTKGAQPPPHAARQKERRRDEDSLEIERPKLPRISHPVIEDHGPAGVGDQSLERQHEYEQIVDLADEGNEVGNEIHRQHDVGDRARDQQLVGIRYSPVGQQSTEQAKEVRQLFEGGNDGALRPGARRGADWRSAVTGVA